MNFKLKTVKCVNALLKDLFIDLRKKVNFWASLTDQTPQAKMGYIGQHLVSAVTGYKGGKSGARGKDLIISETEYAEIKTCTKVDQLGACNDCGMPVSAVETRCSYCDSTNIDRKEDSKWSIKITKEEPEENTLEDSEDVLVNIANPKWYYFVLFEFEDITTNNSPIITTIYRVNPKQNGFILCMIDYFYNLGDNFDMWPHQLKFNLCNPAIIYKSKIKSNNKIETIIFSPDNPIEEKFDNLQQYSRCRNFRTNAQNVLNEFGIPFKGSPTYQEILKAIDEYCIKYNLENSIKIQTFANGFYKKSIQIASKKLSKKGKQLPSVFTEYTSLLL